MTEAHIKGISVLHLNEFVRKTHGDAAFERLAAALPEPAAAVFRHPTASDWVPLAQYIATEVKVLDLLHGGDYSAAFALGKHDLEASIHTIYRFLFLFLEPDFHRSARLWASYMDHGRLTTVRKGPRAATATLTGLVIPHPVYCHEMRGSLTGSLIACGAKTAEVVHTECMQHGAPACVFEASW